MRPTDAQIVDAAVDAVLAEIRRQGLPEEPSKLQELFAKALQRKSDVPVVWVITPDGNAGPSATLIADAVAKKFDRAVELRQRADKTMIGGVVVQIGDERIDMSVRGALNDMRKTLLKDESLFSGFLSGPPQ